MGRTVVGDESQLDSQVDSIFQSGCSVQVGLLVGKSGRGESRDLVFSLIPTPRKDIDEAATLGPSDAVGLSKGASRKGSKGKPAADSTPIIVNYDWVGEHARQVSRMLLGGIQVLGVYIFSAEGSFKCSLATLWQTVKAVATSVSSSFDIGLDSEYLILHISSSPRKLSCRSCSTRSNFSTTALHPCEWKVGKLLNNLQEFSCTYSVDIRHPVHIDNDSLVASNGLVGDLFSGIAGEAERLQTALAVVDGDLLQPNKVVGSGRTVHQVQLLVPFRGNTHFELPRTGGKILGQVVCKGEVHARAYAVVREPVSQAIADLKEDILSSLRARLGLLLDEAQQKADEAALRLERGDSQRDASESSDGLLVGRLSVDVPEQCFIMPRRVIVPWLEGAKICDYMLPNESFEDVEEHAMELFGMKPMHDQSVIIEPEILGSIPSKLVIPLKNIDQNGNESKVRHLVSEEELTNVPLSSRKPSFFIIPALVLIVAILLSLGLTSLSKGS